MRLPGLRFYIKWTEGSHLGLGENTKTVDWYQMNVVPEGRAKQNFSKFPLIWYQSTIFVFSPNPNHIKYPNLFIPSQNKDMPLHHKTFCGQNVKILMKILILWKKMKLIACKMLIVGMLASASGLIWKHSVFWGLGENMKTVGLDQMFFRNRTHGARNPYQRVTLLFILFALTIHYWNLTMNSLKGHRLKN